MTFQSNSCIQEHLISENHTPCFIIFWVVVGQGGVCLIDILFVLIFTVYFHFGGEGKMGKKRNLGR